jgi:hypothetical protein
LQRKSRTHFAEQSINDKRPGNLSSAFFHSLCFKEEYQTASQPLRGLLETQSRRVHGVSIPEPKPSSLCLRVSVFQRRVSDRAPTIARTFGNTESQSSRSLHPRTQTLFSVPPQIVGRGSGPPSPPTFQRARARNHRALISHRLATSGYPLLCASVSLCFKTTRES